MTATSTHLSADPSISDVVWAAYKGGVTSEDDMSPIVSAAAADGCARCGHRTPEMTAVGQVVSKRFTGYSSWTNSAARTLCAACTWAYRTPALRSAAHLVTRGPAALTTLTPTNLHQVLAGPIDARTAIIVPLVPGRKHLLPDAQWGRVTVDDLALDWTAADRDRLQVMARLRGRGFTETVLAAAAPDYRTLAGLAPEAWPAIFDDWAALDPWRAAPPWWQLASRALR